jgi:hypothetical protein
LDQIRKKLNGRKGNHQENRKEDDSWTRLGRRLSVEVGFHHRKDKDSDRARSKSKDEKQKLDRLPSPLSAMNTTPNSANRDLDIHMPVPVKPQSNAVDLTHSTSGLITEIVKPAISPSRTSPGPFSPLRTCYHSYATWKVEITLTS